MKLFLGKYDIYLFPVLKFALALIAFLAINANVGFMSRLTNPGIALILALMCAFLPLNVTAVFGAGLILAHMYALSLEAFAITFVLFALMVLLFFRTAPKYGYLLIITPLAFGLRIPYVIPLAMGLMGTPVAAIPVACGTVVYFLLHYVRLNTAILGNTETSTMTEKITYLLDNAVNNKEMLLTAAAFALTLILVYVIRRMSVDHSWSIAIAAGTVTDIIVLLFGSLLLDITPQILSVLLGSLISAGIAVLLQITVFSLDYSRTEYVQFEDDEYYYYVKAVPKITIAVPEKTVKIAVIGCGARAHVVVNHLLREGNGRIKVASLYDPDREMMAEKARLWDAAGALQCGSHQEAIAAPGIEWVMVCSPNCAHKEHILAAFAAGKHVFAEKPLATAMEECRTIHAAHQQSGRLFA